MTDLEISFSAVSIPSASDGIDITVYEDVGADGSGDNTDPNGKAYNNASTVSLADGVTSYTVSGFDGADGNEVWVRVMLSPGETTATPSVIAPIEVTTL